MCQAALGLSPLPLGSEALLSSGPGLFVSDRLLTTREVASFLALPDDPAPLACWRAPRLPARIERPGSASRARVSRGRFVATEEAAEAATSLGYSGGGGFEPSIAELVFFLASHEAGYITGASIDINGGDLLV